MDVKKTLFCYFCGASSHERFKLYMAPSETVFICDKCISYAYDDLAQKNPLVAQMSLPFGRKPDLSSEAGEAYAKEITHLRAKAAESQREVDRLRGLLNVALANRELREEKLAKTLARTKKKLAALRTEFSVKFREEVNVRVKERDYALRAKAQELGRREREVEARLQDIEVRLEYKGGQVPPINVPGIQPLFFGKKEGGIYFLALDGVVQYVGKSVDVRSRVAVHLRDKQFNEAWFLPVEDIRELEPLETAVIRWLRPPLNKSAGLSLSAETRASLLERHGFEAEP